MSYGASPYSQPPPAYDEEASQPLMGPGDDMYKETVANSSVEIRLRNVNQKHAVSFLIFFFFFLLQNLSEKYTLF